MSQSVQFLAHTSPCLKILKYMPFVRGVMYMHKSILGFVNFDVQKCLLCAFFEINVLTSLSFWLILGQTFCNVYMVFYLCHPFLSLVPYFTAAQLDVSLLVFTIHWFQSFLEYFQSYYLAGVVLVCRLIACHLRKRLLFDFKLVIFMSPQINFVSSTTSIALHVEVLGRHFFFNL